MNEIDRLERWTLSGAHWRVLHRSDDEVTISLITCTGGEEVERFTSRDEEFLQWLGERASDASDCE